MTDLVQTPDAPFAAAGIIKAMLPRVVRHEVATEDESDMETLDRRLTELVQADATYIGEMIVGTWALKPDARARH